MVVGKVHVHVAVSVWIQHHYHHTIVASTAVVIATIVVAVIPVRVHLASVSNSICRTLHSLNIPFLSQQPASNRTFKVLATKNV